MKNLATFLLLSTASIATISSAQDLELAAGHNHFCVLDAEGAKCWGGARRGVAITGVPGGPCLSQPSSAACRDDDMRVAPRFQSFINPDRIFAGGENTCVHDAQGLHCFGRIATPEDSLRLKNPVGVAVGAGHVCVYHDRNYKCYDLDGKWIEERNGSVVPLSGGLGGSHGAPLPQIMTAGALSTCVPYESAISCTLGLRGTNSPIYTEGAFAASQALLDLCFLTREHHCGGLADGDIALRCHQIFDGAAFDTKSEFTVCPNQLHQPSAVATGPNHTCILDDDGVACIDRRLDQGAFPHIRRIEAMGRPSKIAVADHMVCGIADIELVCYDLGRNALSPPPIAAVDLAAFSFRLDRMPENLRRIADYVYEDKAKFFKGLAEEAERYALADGMEAAKSRLFILNVIKPVIERTETPFFARVVTPPYLRRLQALNSDHGVSALSNFQGDGPNRIALVAMRLGIETTREYLARPGDRELADAALAAVGAALAQGASAGAIARAVSTLLEAEPVFTELSVGPSAPGRGLMMLSVLSYLQSVR